MARFFEDMLKSEDGDDIEDIPPRQMKVGLMRTRYDMQLTN